jgi:hypothetical protein
MNRRFTRGLSKFSIASAVIAALVLVLPSLSVSAQPLPPNRFFGRVTANGQAAAGATINALVGTTTCGSSTTDGSGSYRLDVLSSGERPGCGTDGATVIFNVGGQRASQTATWRQGEFTSLDLNASPAPATATPAASATATSVAPTATPSVVVPGTATVTRTATPVASPPANVVVPQTGSGGGDTTIASAILALTGLIVLGAASVVAVRRARS